MLHEYKGKYPVVEEDVFLAPGCQIIGDVKIAKGSSIWYNAILGTTLLYTAVKSPITVS
ncbi:MAG: hypothetical protein PWQ66_1037 [Petrotoga sp.]|nr:hypothetical protein [Petrotoga sp.]